MPNRLIREYLLTHPAFNRLEDFPQNVYLRLITVADDYGNMDGRIPLLTNTLYPTTHRSDEELTRALSDLEREGFITFYRRDGTDYLTLCYWNNDQNVRTKKHKYPPPEGQEDEDADAQNPAAGCSTAAQNRSPVSVSISESSSGSLSVSEALSVYEGQIPVIPASAGKGRGPSNPLMCIPPPLRDVIDFCRRENLRMDPEKFYNYYDSRGWITGGAPIRNWHAACRVWAAREVNPPKQTLESRYDQRSYGPEFDDLPPEMLEVLKAEQEKSTPPMTEGCPGMKL